MAKSAKKTVGKVAGKATGHAASSTAKGTTPKAGIRDRADGLRRSGHFAQALELYERHLVDHPEDLQALLDRGSVLMSLERFTEAAQVYSKMVEIKPDETALSNLGAALIRLGRANEAKVVLDYALEINPKNINARINLGGVLQALGMHQDGLKNALEAVSIDPTQPLAFNNLGSALFDLAKFPEAKHAFETATLLDSKNLDAHINLANIESKLGAPQACIAVYQKALSLLPPEAKQRAEAIRFYMSFEYLKQGMLPEGWDCYEGGFSNLVPVAGARHPRRQFVVPRWNGEMLNGKTLLVWREQGLGDELLFATCLHELEALGGKVIVECDKRLVEPFARSFPQYTVRAEALLPDQGLQSPYKDFDLHVPLGSLMKYFRRDIKDFERSGSYLKTDPAKVAKFAERLARYKEEYRLVGICWRSSKLDPVRSLSYLPIQELGDLLSIDGVKLVNLQYGECEDEIREVEMKFGIEILRWKDLDLKDDLDDVFALIQNLDAVASVRTSVLVMGAASGTPVVGIHAGGGWTLFGRSYCDPWFDNILFTHVNDIRQAISRVVVQRELQARGLISKDRSRLPSLVELYVDPDGFKNFCTYTQEVRAGESRVRQSDLGRQLGVGIIEVNPSQSADNHKFETILSQATCGNWGFVDEELPKASQSQLPYGFLRALTYAAYRDGQFSRILNLTNIYDLRDEYSADNYWQFLAALSAVEKYDEALKFVHELNSKEQNLPGYTYHELINNLLRDGYCKNGFALAADLFGRQNLSIFDARLLAYSCYKSNGIDEACKITKQIYEKHPGIRGVFGFLALRLGGSFGWGERLKISEHDDASGRADFEGRLLRLLHDRHVCQEKDLDSELIQICSESRLERIGTFSTFGYLDRANRREGATRFFALEKSWEEAPSLDSLMAQVTEKSEVSMWKNIVSRMYCQGDIWEMNGYLRLGIVMKGVGIDVDLGEMRALDIERRRYQECWLELLTGEIN